jgi:hypothetical protein
MFLRTEGAQQPGETAMKDARPLEDIVPRFESRWEDKKLLESISGIIKDNEEEGDIKAEEEAQMKAIAEAEARKKAAAATARPRGGAAGAARRGGRAKTTARGGAVNVG